MFRASSLRRPVTELIHRRTIFNSFTQAVSPQPDLVQNGQVEQKNIEAYIRQLGQASPKDAISAIEKGWVSGKVPMSEPILKEYFKAASALKKIDGIDVSGLLAMLNKQYGGNIKSGTGVDMSAILASTNRGVSSGSTPKDPLYVSQLAPTFKSQLWFALKLAFAGFLFVSLMGSMIDEKFGGIAARLGASSIVHQAEKSTKSFDDVVGVDEAKAELVEIVEYLKNPRKFTRLGGKLPKVFDYLSDF
jgi:hypothetical protein